jgi:hypothetical protein
MADQQEPSEAYYGLQHIRGMILIPQLAARTLAEYSVGALIVVNAIGFLITTFYFSRAGIGPSAIPISMMAAAGLSYAGMTLLWSYVGYTVASGKGWKRQLELGSVGVFLLMFLSMAAMTGAPPFRYWSYGAIQFGTSYYYGRGARIRREKGTPLMHDVWTHPEYLHVAAVAYAVLTALIFASWLYPALPRTLGGGGPQGIEVGWANDSLARQFAGKRLFNVFDDSTTVYLGAEKPAPHTWIERFLLHDEDLLDYYSVPRSSILALHFLSAYAADSWGSEARAADAGIAYADAGIDAGIAAAPPGPFVVDAGTGLGQPPDAGTSFEKAAGATDGGMQQVDAGLQHQP